MNKLRTITVPPHTAHPFLLGKSEHYVIAPLGYIDLSNPGADAVFKPLDSTKIRITEGSKVEDKIEYMVENHTDAGVNIDIYSID